MTPEPEAILNKHKATRELEALLSEGWQRYLTQVIAIDVWLKNEVLLWGRFRDYAVSQLGGDIAYEVTWLRPNGELLPRLECEPGDPRAVEVELTATTEARPARLTAPDEGPPGWFWA